MLWRANARDIGDGGMLMHIQELEMVQLHRLKLLFIIFNDGAYEIHKLRADGVDDSGRTVIAAIARGFGLRGANLTDANQFARCSRPIRPRT
jgi:thiamine pyrophosphate-dependent acetolactate synthase large subunit-like protein